MARTPRDTGQQLYTSAARECDHCVYKVAYCKIKSILFAAEDFHPLEGAANHPVLRHLSGACSSPVLEQLYPLAFWKKLAIDN